MSVPLQYICFNEPSAALLCDCLGGTVRFVLRNTDFETSAWWTRALTLQREGSFIQIFMSVLDVTAHCPLDGVCITCVL